MKKAAASLIVLVILLGACSGTDSSEETKENSGAEASESATAAASPEASPSEALSPSASPSPEKLPLAEARVAGRYLGGGLGFDLAFVPKCKSGPCDVWGVTKKSKSSFDQDGGFYRGGGTFHEDCSAGGVTTDMAIKLRMTMRVSKAEYVKDVWTATVLDFQARVDSPGAKKSVTSGGYIRTVTCDPVHNKSHGKMFLKGH